MKARVENIIESNFFKIVIMLVIVFNAAVIGVESSLDLSSASEHLLKNADTACLIIYIIEAVLKIYVYRKKYFKDGWNIFDFVIIILALVPSDIIGIPIQLARVFRIFRMFRVFKLVSAFRHLRIIIEAIIQSVPGVVWTMLLLLIIYYVYAIMGIDLFGDRFPEYFGNIPSALFTLFQLTTMENWTEVARTVIDVYPLSWMYFIPFILAAAFIITNIVVGIIVNSMDECRKNVKKQDEGKDYNLEHELKELQNQIAKVNSIIAEYEKKGKEIKSNEK